MPNNRIFYPVHMVAIKDNDGTLDFALGDEVHGVQSMSMTTNFNTQQTNELGTQTIYENVEGTPNVEVSISKVLDGYPTPYLLSTQKAVAPTLIARSAVRCTLGAAVFPDTNPNASGTPESAVAISGAYVDSVSYNFTTDGNFSEDTTFVANDKLWYVNFAGTSSSDVPDYGESDLKAGLPSITFSAAIPQVDSPIATVGIARSQDFIFDLSATATGVDSNGAVNDPDTTVMPREIAGFTTSGTNPIIGGAYGAHVSSFTCSVSLSREDINELGRRGPYFRAATFPVEVTSELQVTADQGDLVSALDGGIFGTGVGRCSADSVNTKDRTIRAVICDGLRLYLGVRNRLQSVGYSGGDADGGNVTISYTYTNYNDFTVMHERDPHFVSGSIAAGTQSGLYYSWADRFTHLVE